MYPPSVAQNTDLINLDRHNSSDPPQDTAPVDKMGFTFKGLTSAALVSKDERGNSAVEKDVADVPASVAGHTSEEAQRNVDKKLGAPRSADEVSDDDSSLNKVDTTAEAGVQRAQAMTLVWTKKELIFGYVKYVTLLMFL